ncbi:MAG: ABC transporter ATP-binding protein [Zoogloeaceae bacterium]|jgi:putative ABC transport system ATP-binding protein|nr:ABC transporter ATP-binding protein [Zoogloeaceae bacterium]
MVSHPQSASGSPVAVSLENVRFRWPGSDRPVLDIPSFAARAGEHVFIAGASGSGKSTLLSLIAGILSPESGRILVDNMSISGMPSARRDIFRGEHIGFIFQQFNLIPYLSVLENVLLPCRLSPSRNAHTKKHAATPLDTAEQLLSRLDIAPDLWQRRADRLSVGQQQRVAAARALIGCPPLVIADEPTSSLDADRQEAFLRLLFKECRASGSTLLFVSHDLNLGHAFDTCVQLSALNRASASNLPEEALP